MGQETVLRARIGAVDCRPRATRPLLLPCQRLGSLRSCPEALRLEDVLDTNGLVLFKLDAAESPPATRKVASWVLLGMGRLARQLPEMREVRASVGRGRPPTAQDASHHMAG